ncbi:hypothetical protein BDW74DRAFT_175044 [Aspergillus multicolor]|uniref:uncharacterized protein n=1 Tax=Aspergillus multicolor TaxID=41759 RepID=UPI003CCCEFED
MLSPFHDTCHVSMLGRYPPRRDILTWKDEDGKEYYFPSPKRGTKFLIHQKCSQLLYTVCNDSDQECDYGDLLKRLGVFMQAHLRDGAVDWGNDPRIYGDAEEFHGEEGWMPRPGRECFVAGPLEQYDFWALVRETTSVLTDPEKGGDSDTEMTVDSSGDGSVSEDEPEDESEDELEDSPEASPEASRSSKEENNKNATAEHHRLTRLLGENLETIVSKIPIYTASFIDGTGLMDDLQTRINHALPWFRTNTWDIIMAISMVSDEGGPGPATILDIPVILEELSVVPKKGDMVRTDYLGLINRTRIWKCCQVIVEKLYAEG